MFHTLSNIQTGDAIPLRQVIDNREGKILVGLRSIIYWVGWHNIRQEERLRWKTDQDGRIISKLLKPGLYSFNQLKEVLMEVGSGIVLEVDKTDGRITMAVPAGIQIQLSPGLKLLLGLDDEGWLDTGTYTGDRPVDFAIDSALHIHLDQVNTSKNMLDGAPSTLIGVVPVPKHCQFGEAASFHFHHPEFRELQDGTVGELKVRVTDSRRNLIENELPISVVLQFGEDEHLRVRRL